jgi:hypothetical protein
MARLPVELRFSKTAHSQMIVPRCFGLIEYFLNTEAHVAGWNLPFEFIAHTMAEHGGSNRSHYRNQAVINARFVREDERIG